MNQSQGLLIAGMLVAQLGGCGDDEAASDPNEVPATTGGSDSGSAGAENDAGSVGSDGGVAGAPAGGSAGGPFGGNAGTPAAGRPGAGGSDSGPALLDLPSTGKYRCDVGRPLELFEEPWVFGEVVDGAQALVRGAPGPQDFGIAERVLWSPIGASGAPSEATLVHDSGTRVYSVGGAARDGRTTIVWAQDEAEAINVVVAQIDDSGEVITEPYAVAPSGSDQSQPQIVATSDGYAVVWTEDPDPYRNDADEALRFAKLDPDGVIVKGPVSALAGTRPRATQLLWTGTTIAATYLDVTSGAALNYLAFDVEGNPISDPILLATDHYASSHLVLRGERVLAAWTEEQGSVAGSGGTISGIVRVGSFDRRGNPVGQPRGLQAPIEDRQAVEPRWLDFGEDLALTWAKGSVIYVCAGCYPDDHLEFVILDGESLQPLSNLVTIDNQVTLGGLRTPRAVRFDSNVLLVTSVTYHTHEEGGSATLECTER